MKDYREYLDYNRNSSQLLSQVYKNISNHLGCDDFLYGKCYYNRHLNYFSAKNSNFVAEYLAKINTETSYFEQFLGVEAIGADTYYFILWPKKPTNESMHIHKKHGIWHGFNIIKFNDDSIEVFSPTFVNLRIDFYQLCYDRKFRKKALLSAIYYSNELNTIVPQCEEQILPRFSERLSISKQLEQELLNNISGNKDILPLIEAYYPKGICVKSANGMVRLTHAEISVLELLSKAYSAKQIQEKLNISVKTVEFHKSNIKNKTGYNLISDLVSIYNDQLRYLFY